MATISEMLLRKDSISPNENGITDGFTFIHI